VRRTTRGPGGRAWLCRDYPSISASNTSTAVAMSAVPERKAGAASGTVGSIRILAVAVGVAVVAFAVAMQAS